LIHIPHLPDTQIIGMIQIKTRSPHILYHISITLWLFNIAMGNSPFIEVYLLKMVIFHGYVK
jgi:hypothetical protein